MVNLTKMRFMVMVNPIISMEIYNTKDSGEMVPIPSLGSYLDMTNSMTTLQYESSQKIQEVIPFKDNGMVNQMDLELHFFNPNKEKLIISFMIFKQVYLNLD